MNMNSLPDITKELVALRKKPSTQARFKQYPALLQRFVQLVDQCEDVEVLREVIVLDDGYYLLAGYRQQVLEKWLSLERTPEVLRQYAMQLTLFGDVDDMGEADTDTDVRAAELMTEADVMEKSQS